MTDYVMLWDCSYCKKKGVLGYIYDCPGCSHPRTRNVIFYDPPTPIVATTAQMAIMGGKDPNWYCLGCDSGNKQSNDACSNCGTPRGVAPDHEQREYGEGQERYTAEEKVALERDTPAMTRTRRPEAASDYNPPIEVMSSKTYSSSNIPSEYQDLGLDSEIRSASLIPQSWLIIGGVSLAVLALSWCIWFFFFNTHQVYVSVQGFGWTQKVTIEEYRTLQSEGWSIPAGGRETGQERRKNGQDKIHDGYRTEYYTDTCYDTEYVSKTCYTDNGNGSKSSHECGSNQTTSRSCQKPRQVEQYHYVDHYDTWYWYDIEQWIEIASKSTSGSNHSPFFDPIAPKGLYNPASPQIGDQRRIEYLGTYTVFFRCDDLEDFSRVYDLRTWTSFQMEKDYQIEVNPVNAIIKYPVP